jgi:hypothetical protein
LGIARTVLNTEDAFNSLLGAIGGKQVEDLASFAGLKIVLYIGFVKATTTGFTAEFLVTVIEASMERGDLEEMTTRA